MTTNDTRSRRRGGCQRRRRRRGFATLYAVVALIAMCGVAMLAVDWGRVQLVKTELAGAADTAARAGAGRISTSAAAAQDAAVAAAGYNRADGSAVVLQNQDVQIGRWDVQTNTFSVTSGSNRNAVRVTARRTSARNNAVALSFGQVLGRPTQDVSATTVAMLVTTPSPKAVTNTSNPWLAGMPAGTRANGYDSAPTASPTLLRSGGLTAGAQITFDVTGATSNQSGVEAAYAADGNLGWIISNYSGNEHGIANLTAPISSLIGVFLNDNQPNASSAPASLDFTSSSSRDFSTLSPQLKQPFFIGDGRRANGAAQQFTVPAGATRLYVGSMDGQQWSDNAGGFSVTLNGLPAQDVVVVQ